MNKITSIILGLLLLTLTACNEKSASLTPSDEGAPQLAAESTDQILLKTKTGDGPLIERMVTPVKWDGQSELLQGVVYSWASYEEAMAAYESRNPETYKALKDISDRKKLSPAGVKAKVNERTSLAYSPTVYTNVWRTGGYYNGLMHAECSIYQPAPSAATEIYFFMALDYMEYPGGPIDNIVTLDTTYFNNQDSHYYYFSTETRPCPAIMSANAHLYVGSESPYWFVSWDDDGCGW